jgi:hypothetical protein
MSDAGFDDDIGLDTIDDLLRSHDISGIWMMGLPIQLKT